MSIQAVQSTNYAVDTELSDEVVPSPSVPQTPLDGAEQIQKIAKLEDQKKLTEANASAEKIKKVGAGFEKFSTAGGAAVGAIIGTIILPGPGTAVGATLGGAIGKLGGVLVRLACDAIGNRKQASAEEAYGDGQDIGEKAENMGEVAQDASDAFDAFKSVQAEREALSAQSTASEGAVTQAASSTAEATVAMA